MKPETAKNLMEKVVSDYSDIAEDFHKTRKADWKEFNIFLDFINDGETLVDLGCGNGRFCHFVRKHRKIKYIGIDNNEKLLEKAKENIQANSFIKADMTAIPLPGGSINTACAIASFHHIPSASLRKQALREIHRILKSDGKLILSVWNLFQPKYKKYIWYSRAKWLLSFGKYDLRDTFIPWSDSGVKRYYHAFTVKELKKLLEELKFEVVSEHTGRNLTLVCRKY